MTPKRSPKSGPMNPSKVSRAADLRLISLQRACTSVPPRGVQCLAFQKQRSLRQGATGGCVLHRIAPRFATRCGSSANSSALRRIPLADSPFWKGEGKIIC
jgi:hypothetical protein